MGKRQKGTHLKNYIQKKKPEACRGEIEASRTGHPVRRGKKTMLLKYDELVEGERESSSKKSNRRTKAKVQERREPTT